MKTARSDLVILFHRQQSEHPRRQFAVNRQMWPHDAVPIFDSTTNSYSLIPGAEQLEGICLPSRWNALQQLCAGRPKDGSSQPSPSQQGYCLRPQSSAHLYLDRIKPTGKQQRARQCQTDLFREHVDLPLHGCRGQGYKLVQQIQDRGDLALTLCAVEQGDGLVEPGNDHFQQRVQFVTEIANAVGYIAHLSHQCLLLGKLSLGTFPTRSFSLGLVFRTPLDL